MKVPFFGVGLFSFIIILVIGMFIALKWPNNLVTSQVNKIA